MERIEKTVFISYRRKDVYLALNVYQDLMHKGYDVFFDYTSIPSGDFEQIIIGNIKARAHFVIILTPTSFDKCSEPGDWLRREIETAIDEKRNIVPLFFNGFDFIAANVSEKLTGKLKNVSRYNGMNVHHDYFQAAMERLCTQFLNVPLDSVLHPVSAEVREAVKEERHAVNEALLQISRAKTIIPQKSITAPKPEEKITNEKIILAEKDETSVWLESLRANYSVKLEEPAVAPKNIDQDVPDWLRGLVKSEVVSKQPASNFSTNKLTLSNAMEFMRVPAGTFLMGSMKENRNAFTDEYPQHIVDIPYDYWVARSPVTNELFNAYVKAKGINHPVSDWGKKKDHPVISANWRETMKYCQWMNNLLKNELPSGLVLRLPTEAEWEKAARGIDAREYPWGNEFDKNKCNTSEGAKKDTTPVGLYSPHGDSPYDCTDMAGNVWEWTHSLYKPYPYRVNDGREGENTIGIRVLRGGSFNVYERGARCADRTGHRFHYYYGFRVVAAPPQ